MFCYRDRTFCASPDCKNECGRKMNDYDKGVVQREEIPVMWGYFCGEPKRKDDNEYFDGIR